jgi:hypothetical protein
MKPLRNEHTGHLLKTKVQNDKYSDGWDAIFGKGKQKDQEKNKKNKADPVDAEENKS